MQNFVIMRNSLSNDEIKKLTKFLISLGYDICDQNQELQDISILVLCIDEYRNDFSNTIKKCREQYPMSKIICSTVDRSFELARQCISLKIDYILLKPYTLDELKNAIKKCTLKNDVNLENNYSNLVNKSVTYIKDNYNKGITLKEMAEDLNVSNWHLCKALKLETGKNFIEIVTELRINKAKVLLKETDMKVCEISSFLGISEITYFINMFKKHVGVSPSIFREKQKTIANLK